MPEERRIVTILFADVAGSTALGEASDPEDVRAVLGRYYAIAREVVSPPTCVASNASSEMPTESRLPAHGRHLEVEKADLLLRVLKCQRRIALVSHELLTSADLSAHLVPAQCGAHRKWCVNALVTWIVRE